MLYYISIRDNRRKPTMKRKLTKTQELDEAYQIIKAQRNLMTACSEYNREPTKYTEMILQNAIKHYWVSVHGEKA